MAINYTAMANTAKALVDANGRDCTFVQFNETPADSAAPWKGPTDARVSPVQSHVLKAVAVDVGTVQKLGTFVLSEDLLKRVSQFLVVAPGAAFAGDLREVHEVVDDSTRWRVLAVHQLKPANLPLVYFLAVGR